jgi:hypothetical protein
MFEGVTKKERMGLPALAAVAVVAVVAGVAFAGMLVFAKEVVGDPTARAVAAMLKAPVPVEQEAEDAALARAFRVDEEIEVIAPYRPHRLARGREVARGDERWAVPVAEAAPMCPVVR